MARAAGTVRATTATAASRTRSFRVAPRRGVGTAPGRCPSGVTSSDSEPASGRDSKPDSASGRDSGPDSVSGTGSASASASDRGAARPGPAGSGLAGPEAGATGPGSPDAGTATSRTCDPAAGPCGFRLARAPPFRLVGQDPLPVQCHKFVRGRPAHPREAFDRRVVMGNGVAVAVAVHGRGAHVQLLRERPVAESRPLLQPLSSSAKSWISVPTPTVPLPFLPGKAFQGSDVCAGQSRYRRSSVPHAAGTVATEIQAWKGCGHTAAFPATRTSNPHPSREPPCVLDLESA